MTTSFELNEQQAIGLLRVSPGFRSGFRGKDARPRQTISTRRQGTICRSLRLGSHLGGLTVIPSGRPDRQNSTVLVH